MTLEERIRHLCSVPAPPNEESAKAQFVQPILRLLGWPSDDPNLVYFEYAAGGGRVDIALRTGGRFVAFIEAKAPGKNLANHVTQLLQYAFHEGVDLCALTTGLEWWLYLPREKGPPKNRRFAVVDITKTSAGDCAEQLRRFLGLEALEDHSAESDAKRALKNLRIDERLMTEIPAVWRKMRSQPDPELVRLVQKRVEAEIGLPATPAQVGKALGMAVPSPAKREDERGAREGWPKPGTKSHRVWELAESHATRGEAVAAAVKEGINLNTAQAQYRRWRLGKPGRRPRPASAGGGKPGSYRLWGTDTRLKTWRELLIGVFEAVQARHGAAFPETVRPLWGKNKPWVSANRHDLRAPRLIGQSGLFVEGHLSANNIEKRCRRLLRAFGYPESDLEIRHD